MTINQIASQVDLTRPISLVNVLGIIFRSGRQ